MDVLVCQMVLVHLANYGSGCQDAEHIPGDSPLTDGYDYRDCKGIRVGSQKIS